MPTGREQFFDVARSEGVRYLFANPGTTELPLFDELARETGIELILALQEATAVAAADGYAQATRAPSLVNLHIAPGVANGLGNIINARWHGSPVVITAGQQNTKQMIQEPMLAGDLVGMVSGSVKWAYEVLRPEDIGVAMRRAFKIAATPPTGPVFLSIPWDFLDEPCEATAPPRSRIEHGATAAGIEDAARMLAAAKRPLLIAGDEVARAGAVGDLVELAEAVGARVVGEPLHSRLVFPMDHPLWTGSLPPVNDGIAASLAQGDVVLAVGAVLFAPFFYRDVPAVPDDVTLIQIDPDAHQIAKTYPVALGLHGDVAATLRALTAAIRSHAPAGAVERSAEYTAARAQAVAGLTTALDQQRAQSPLPSIAACAAVVDAFEGEAVSVVDESVTATAGLRAVLRQRDPDSYFFFRGGGLGWGIPASAGVSLAQPDRKVVAVVGDGATCYVPQALWTLAHHDIPSTIVVLNNGGYYILKAQLLAMGRESAKADRYVGTDIADPTVDFVSLAAAFGVPAERVEKADELTSAVRKAMGSRGPSLIEVAVDATVRPLG
jgi:benzoylformate decarboxylase